MSDHYSTYVKYKSNYIGLKRNIILNVECYIDKIIGGTKGNLIIHISGPSGAGKTTLGKKLKKKFGNKIVVKDLDDLCEEFIHDEYGKILIYKNIKFNKDNYQKWIDNYILKQHKPLIFVGINHMQWWHKDHYYDMHSKYDFYIELDTNTVFKQKCNRYISDIFIDGNEKLLNDLIEKEKETIANVMKDFKYDCGYEGIKNMNEIWNNDYKKQGYIFMSRDNILKKVSKIIKKELSD